MNTRTWTRFDGLKEEVEIGSDREKELDKQLNDAGLYREDDPNKPDDCLNAFEFSEFLDREKAKPTEQRFEEYKQWKSKQ